MENKANSQNNQPSILIVDDDQGIRSQLKWALNNEYHILTAENADEAVQVIENNSPDLVTLDISLTPYGDIDGMKVLERISRMDSDIKVIMITGNEEKDIVLRAISLDAYDYYQKPIDMDELKIIIKRALYIQTLEKENKALTRKLHNETQFGDIIGDCPKMLEVFSVMKKVMFTDVPVMILGESGTGKELVARAIHYQSSKRDKPFIPINCGAIPENLLESELFGHEKGSFTGAFYQKKGKFELANDGTAFLDEIGELAPALQVKLLRFLQEKEIERIGGKYPIELDVRILAATNRNLEVEINNGNFRSDLFYRLGVITIQLPPLRDRGEDIMLLANTFLAKYADEYKKKQLSFDDECIEKMHQFNWPGNVRELENRIKRAVIMAQNNVINYGDLGLNGDVNRSDESLVNIVDNVQKKYVDMALYRTKGNVSKAARDLGISRVTLYDLLNRFNIEINQYRRSDYH